MYFNGHFAQIIVYLTNELTVVPDFHVDCVKLDLEQNLTLDVHASLQYKFTIITKSIIYCI